MDAGWMDGSLSLHPELEGGVGNLGAVPRQAILPPPPPSVALTAGGKWARFAFPPAPADSEDRANPSSSSADLHRLLGRNMETTPFYHGRIMQRCAAPCRFLAYTAV